MMTHEATGSRSPAEHAGRHRLLPIAGVAVVMVAVLAHLAGGAALMHIGIGGPLASLGGGALLAGLAAMVSIKLLLVFGARHWWRHR